MSLLYIILQIPLSTVAQPEARLAPLPQQLLVQLAVLVQLLLLQPLVQRVQRPALP